MIQYIKGDLIQGVTSGIILQQVNAQGVMGSGFAKFLRIKYPDIFAPYKNITDKSTNFGKDLMGQIIAFQLAPNLYVSNIFGQQFYGTDKMHTDYNALDEGLERTKAFCDFFKITEIHTPMIGCGLGGGDWNIVENLIEKHLGDLNISVWQL